MASISAFGGKENFNPHIFQGTQYTPHAYAYQECEYHARNVFIGAMQHLRQTGARVLRAFDRHTLHHLPSGIKVFTFWRFGVASQPRRRRLNLFEKVSHPQNPSAKSAGGHWCGRPPLGRGGRTPRQTACGFQTHHDSCKNYLKWHMCRYTPGTERVRPQRRWASH